MNIQEQDLKNKLRRLALLNEQNKKTTKALKKLKDELKKSLEVDSEGYFMEQITDDLELVFSKSTKSIVHPDLEVLLQNNLRPEQLQQLYTKVLAENALDIALERGFIDDKDLGIYLEDITTERFSTREKKQRLQDGSDY